VLRKDDLPLVGNKAPDFEAEAVFDQEFINVSGPLSLSLSLSRARARNLAWFMLWKQKSKMFHALKLLIIPVYVTGDDIVLCAFAGEAL
jgi:hypothetical protein